MELLNEKVINSKSFELLQLMLKKRYMKDNNSEFITSYNEFKNQIIIFVETIMKSLLEDTKYCNDKYSCIIKKLPSYYGGVFGLENNIITINEKVINDIYLGKINSMVHIFHELNHFKNKYDIKLGKINKDIIRSLKEDLLRIATEEFDKKISGKCYDNTYGYYESNYKVLSEEKLADMNAIINFISFIEIIGIELSEQDLRQLKNEFINDYNQYNDYLRDLRFVFCFNNNFLDFESAFDSMIKSNPIWLMYDQLKIEYYLDENGKVVKRTEEELKERLKTETDEDIKEYIQYLLTHSDNKKLSRSDFSSGNEFLKHYKSKYEPIINNSNSRFKR